jgi:myo-inositol-1(or 4)-monophosphatase
MDYENICKKSIQLSQEIGDWIVNERIKFSQGNVETKAFNNLVSYVDKEAEKRFVEGLLKLLPGSGILGEEGSSIDSDNEYIWIIDPLDGTTNFVHGIPVFCTSVALKFKDQTVLGVVYEPNRKECFHAYKGSKAFCNNLPIKVSQNTNLSVSLIATGFPYDDFSRQENYIEILKDLMNETRGIRRLGAAALDLCYVAAGRFEGFYEYALQPWDVAAGAFIVQQAGGKVTDFKNENQYHSGNEIIASNELIHDQLQSKIRHYFCK